MLFAEHKEYENDLVDSVISAAVLMGYSYEYREAVDYLRNGLSSSIRYKEIRIRKNIELTQYQYDQDIIVMTVSKKTGKLLVGYQTRVIAGNFVTYKGVKEYYSSYDMSVEEVMNRVMKWL